MCMYTFIMHYLAPDTITERITVGSREGFQMLYFVNY